MHFIQQTNTIASIPFQTEIFFEMLQPQKSKPQSLESLLETLIIEESHKTRYARNLELVRAKNKKNLNLSLDIEHMKKSCNHNKIKFL